MTSDLEDLMNLDPLNLSKQDIDKIIVSMRQTLASYQSGAKPLKVKPKIDTKSLEAALAPEQPKLRRI